MITVHICVRVRRHDVVRLEVMRRDALACWVFLSARCARVEEIVDTLEGAPTRATHLGVLVECRLQLYIREACEHLVPIDALTYVVTLRGSGILATRVLILLALARYHATNS